MGGSVAERVGRLDWPAVEQSLDERGYATTPHLLSRAECVALARLFTDERRFRSRVDMARFRFGVGEYKYFAAPLPPLVTALRTHLYRRLVPVANRWAAALGASERYPPELRPYLARCHA